MKKQIKPRAIAIAQKYPTRPYTPGRQIETNRRSTTDRYTISRRGLWNLLLFLLVSVAAFSVQDFNLFAAVPEKFWSLLGAPPPPQLLNLGLGIYLFAALVLLPERMNKAIPAQGWAQIGYRISFYLLYLASNALAANFLLILAAGLLLYGLEQAYLWLPRFSEQNEGSDL